MSTQRPGTDIAANQTISKSRVRKSKKRTTINVRGEAALPDGQLPGTILDPQNSYVSLQSPPTTLSGAESSLKGSFFIKAGMARFSK